MNILIVDDEYYIVQGILKSVNWKTLNIKETYCAYSMKQALQILNEQKIHIILTDIEMPKGSGLDLIEIINQKPNKLIKLLLTGHENFNYAKKAIELGCYQYLVKPLQAETLESALHDAIKKFKQIEETEHAQTIASSWNTTIQLKYNRFWSEITKGNLDTQEAISNALLRYDLDKNWSSKSFRFTLIHRYSSPFTKKEIAHDWNLLDKNINKKPEFIYHIDQNNCLHIDMYNENSSNQILKLLKKNFPTDTFTLFVSDSISLYESIQYYAIVLELIKTSFSVINLIVTISLYSTETIITTSIRQLNYEVWSRLILENRSDLILNELESQYVKKSVLYSLADLRLINQRLLHAIMNAFESTGHSIDSYPSQVRDIIEEDPTFLSLNSLLNWATRLLQEVAKSLQQDNDKDIFLIRVKKHIQDNLSSNSLGRNSISEEIHMNPDYISFLFHKLSDTNLSTYISNERIHVAKKLLLTTNLSLQEVAMQTGYSNSSYFHKQFKKLTGLTPLQFRKQER